ncbi:MAG: methyltransferase domain-containing protein [Fusobacteriales bacterium]|jgi:ubiquinone/menaquinone biosynthesis C-methylase UbiE|nr:methyltransferase domain-containing protein [Fusobacteriales bacterium]
MLFYKDISIYYEKIFPLNPAAVEFLEEELNGKKKILDLACGDGKYSNSLVTPDRSVTGVDLDKGMLEEAEKKYDQNNNIKFVYGDMSELSSVFQKDKVDGVFCIGNSLVHLTSTDEIKKALTELDLIMEDGGKLVIQIINYDRILNDDINFLPAIKSEDTEFIRNYHRYGNSRIIDFHTILKTADRERESHQELYSLTKDELVFLAEKEGFALENVYSSFKKEEWNNKSLQSVFVFKKKK